LNFSIPVPQTPLYWRARESYDDPLVAQLSCRLCGTLRTCELGEPSSGASLSPRASQKPLASPYGSGAETASKLSKVVAQIRLPRLASFGSCPSSPAFAPQVAHFGEEPSFASH